MVSWEQEVFEKEYSEDLNWFKGKQAKHRTAKKKMAW